MGDSDQGKYREDGIDWGIFASGAFQDFYRFRVVTACRRECEGAQGSGGRYAVS